MSNPADFFMKIMSIESIEMAQLKDDAADEKAEAQQKQEVAEEYRKRIEWFID